MPIIDKNGNTLRLTRPNPLVAQVKNFWDDTKGNYDNWSNFAPVFIQEQPRIQPPPIPQFKEVPGNEHDTPIPEFQPVNIDDDELYSGDPQKVAGSLGIKPGEARTIEGGYDPYDPEFDNLHFSIGRTGK